MVDSYELAEEQEFADLYLDEEKAIKANDRWYQKYEKRLGAADKKGEEESKQVYAEMQARVVDELVTASFRSEVDERLLS